MTNSLADIVVKATPGPWGDGSEAIAVEIDRERPWASTVFRSRHDGTEANALVAMTFGATVEEAVASAQLIALAPTLATLVLEAREALQKWLVYDGHDAEAFSGVRPMLDYAEAIEATRATLAKLEALKP